MPLKETNMPNVRKRLVYKLARNVVIVSLCIGLLMSVLITYQDLQATNKFFHETIQQVLKTTTQPAARAAYNLNDELAGEVANGLMEYQSIISVTILDDLHNTLTSKSRILGSTPHRWIAESGFGGLQSFEIELRTIDDAEVRAGYMQIIADPVNIASEFIHRAASKVLVILLESLIIAVILSLFFYRLFISPLQNISQSLAETDPDNPLDTQLVVPPRNLGDELFVLAESGNRLLRSIATRIEERDTAEDELRKAAETLEQRIIERTAELAEQFEAAKAASKAKQEFLASMSHEIRTPMAGVMGLADMLLDEDLSSVTREKVEKIKEETQSLLVIINDILDLSKIDSGKLHIENIDFHLRNELDKTIEIIQRPAKEKSLQLKTEFADDLLNNLYGDPTRLRQILINLLGNAVKFTEKGHVCIAVSQQKIADDNSWLIINISDTGIGIAPEKLDDLFEEFTQADASINRRYEGTGLGLAISKRLVEFMGGSISVSSVLGKGTDFEFRIPLKESQNSASEEKTPPKAEYYKATRQLNILAVDDNPLNLRIAAAMMAKYGHKVELANNGQEAVDRVQHNGFDAIPDLILMDIRMPEMSGPEATIKIRAMEGEAGIIPIIALTADAMEDHVREYYEVGMNAFVPKPIDPILLLTEINRVMSEEVHKPTPPPENDKVATAVQ